MRGFPPFLAILVAAFVPIACSDGPSAPGASAAEPPPLASITGTISFRERMALTSEAVAVVSLQDASRQDAPATVLAQQTIEDPGQVPIRFALDYPRSAIDPRGLYVLRAHISDGGRLLFTTDRHTPVLTRGAGDEAHLLLVAVGGSNSDAVIPAAADPGQPLRGMFRYMADAARFRDCRTEQDFPVAMEGAYIEVERAYSNSGIEPGSEVLIEVVGRYLERPVMEGNSTEINLIIDFFKNLLPDTACTPNPPLP